MKAIDQFFPKVQNVLQNEILSLKRFNGLVNLVYILLEHHNCTTHKFISMQSCCSKSRSQLVILQRIFLDGLIYLCIHQISVISDLKSDMIADTLEWIKQRARIKAAVGTAASQTARPTATIRYMAHVRIWSWWIVLNAIEPWLHCSLISTHPWNVQDPKGLKG